ncbi:XdhC family protein [Cellulophaga sp. E16_2]|uniref:XdhC family protein n=1 Tax=Cellulophaga sp. E16_2 TaxID=2789297 RepID=UPI001A92658A|nr:XdhC/CoxI family protein [Cellulophaga sp. E16_2]MBO0593727.1 XdhC family protein [Cellulophaga sp. E16_2]
MTHEFKKIVAAYQTARDQGIKTVLATVVALEGSSYRKPGVRMLLLEGGSMIGAVSGGCVEKEILVQSQSVFKTEIPKVMTYDGRYRLGCEGVLYILLEPFSLSDLFVDTFNKALKGRITFKITSFYKKEAIEEIGLGTKVQFQNSSYPISLRHPLNTALRILEERMMPCFKLLVIGAEHDAVVLSAMAGLMGWEVIVLAHPSEGKSISDFPGITEFIRSAPESFQPIGVDQQTALVLMNHSYAKDLLFLQALQDSSPIYIGILGPMHRREKLLNELIEKNPEVSEEFISAIHGPSGLNIGSITPQEIALSILAEIMAVIRNENPMFLRDKVNQYSN